MPFDLSNEVRSLLQAAGRSSDGFIVEFPIRGGFAVQVGGETLGGDEGREAARWRNALSDALSNGFIERAGNTTYRLTHQGWTTADELSKEENE